MKQNSFLLRTFTEDTLNARGFLNNAKDHFKSIELCAVSALGAEPVGDRLTNAFLRAELLIHCSGSWTSPSRGLFSVQRSGNVRFIQTPR